MPNAEPDPLLAFRDARQRQAAWAEIGDALRALEKRSVADDDGQPWIYRAAEVSGYQPNQLRRLGRALDFLDLLQKNGSITDLNRYRSIPISHLEVINRFFEVDPTLALVRLESACRGVGTYRALLADYKDAQRSSATQSDPKKAGMRAARHFEETCSSLIRRNFRQFQFGIDCRLIRPGRLLQYVHPDFVLIQSQATGSDTIDGVTCKALTTTAHKRFITPIISEVAFAATFFERYWIMIPEGPLVGDLTQDFENLDLGNVGVVSVIDDLEPEIKVIRTPRKGPVPDRRQLLEKSRLMAQRSF